MSWIPRVEGWSTDNERLNVAVAYYDSTDTGFVNPLASRSFTVEPDDFNATALGKTVKLWGANAKAAQAKKTAAETQFPVGFTLTAIP
jgi:hypothetical protein